MVKCGDCRHYKDRYTLFLHGGFPVLKKLLELNLIDERDFICEGWGCVYHPVENFVHDTETGDPIFIENMEDIECKHFEPLCNRKELTKNIYRGYPSIDPQWGKTHLDISDIEINNASKRWERARGETDE